MQKIEISHRTIFFTVLLGLGLYLLFLIRQIIGVFFIALVLMSALNPIIKRLEKWHLPRILGILVVYLLIFASLGLIVAGIIPPLVDQTSVLLGRFPDYVQELSLPSIDHNFLESQLNQLGSLPGSVLKLTMGVFNNLLTFFVIMVLTFYLLIERKNLNKYLLFLFGSGREKKAKKFVDELENKLGGWVRAQVTLMAIIGLMSYFGLRLLGIDFALPLALLAGVLEIIPNVGPTLAAIPAALIALSISPLMGLAVVALYFLIQQIENTIIVPQVMARETGVNPLVSILSLAIGYRLAGVAGVILAIPVVILIQVIASEIYSSHRFKHL